MREQKMKVKTTGTKNEKKKNFLELFPLSSRATAILTVLQNNIKKFFFTSTFLVFAQKIVENLLYSYYKAVRSYSGG